jgi:hypothetical protein
VPHCGGMELKMTAHKHLLMHKYETVIEEVAVEEKLPIRSAMDVFYHSKTYQDMREGFADMHCRSDIYLAEEIRRENA